MTGWEVVIADNSGPLTRRLKVPGGWLYQTEIDALHEPLVTDPDNHPNIRVVGWGQPVYVPDPDAVRR